MLGNYRRLTRLLIGVAPALLGQGAGPGVAQTPATVFQTTIVGKAGLYFEGEPIYILVTIRNPGTIARVIPTVSALIRSSTVSVRTSAGADVTRAVGTVDVVGRPVPDTLLPGGTLHWVIPIHWFWGSYQEASEAWNYYAFAPGQYRMALVFPAQYGIEADSLDFVVRQRLPEETRARAAFLAGTARALADVRRGGDASSALNTIRSLSQDPSLSPYATLLLCDVASALEGSARRYSPAYRASLDRMRAERALSRSGPDQGRLVQHLAAESLDSLVIAMPALGSVPYVGERLLEIRRGRNRP